jgi:hypothetical protein
VCARAATWLAARRSPATGLWTGRFGDTEADLALSAVVGLALLHAGADVADLARSLAAEVAELERSGWRDGRRSHLCYQLPLVLLFFARRPELEPEVRAAASSLCARRSSPTAPSAWWPPPGRARPTTPRSRRSCCSSRPANLE